MNVVKPIEGYKSGVSALLVALTGKDNLATQPCEIARRICPDQLELLLFRQVKGVAAVAAWRIRDNVDAFGECVMKDVQSNGVSGWGPDCVDRTVKLVGQPNLTAVRPEE